MCTLALQRGNRNVHPYPFIPFCELPDNTFLLFVNKPDSVIESPVFLGSHRRSEKTWGQLAPDFTSFLELYLHHLGHPPVIEREKDGSATDFFELLVKNQKTSPYLQTQELSLLNEKEQAFYFYQKALDFTYQDDFLNAYSFISNAIETNPADAFYYFFRGEILKEVKKYWAAIIDYDIAVKLDSTNSFYRCCRAEFFFLLNKFDQALADCNDALKKDSKVVLPYYLRKDIYLVLDEINKAEADQKTIDFLENKK
jgi:tetratricopeptide (TPR) repeat protein